MKFSSFWVMNNLSFLLFFNKSGSLKFLSLFSFLLLVTPLLIFIAFILNPIVFCFSFNFNSMFLFSIFNLFILFCKSFFSDKDSLNFLLYLIRFSFWLIISTLFEANSFFISWLFGDKLLICNLKVEISSSFFVFIESISSFNLLISSL